MWKPYLLNILFNDTKFTTVKTDNMPVNTNQITNLQQNFTTLKAFNTDILCGNKSVEIMHIIIRHLFQNRK